MPIQKIYNSLTNLGRRKNMAIYYFTASMTMIPVGFAVFLWGIDKGNNFNRIFGVIIIALAVILWAIALRKATSEWKGEKEEREKRHQELLEVIRNIKKP